MSKVKNKQNRKTKDYKKIVNREKKLGDYKKIDEREKKERNKVEGRKKEL